MLEMNEVSGSTIMNEQIKVAFQRKGVCYNEIIFNLRARGPDSIIINGTLPLGAWTL